MEKVKPVLILPIGCISKSDMKVLKNNGICVVEAKDPSAVRFLEPPIVNDYSIQEKAAIELCRYYCQKETFMISKDNFNNTLVHFLINGTKLKPVNKVKNN